jgi:hypothetical protein
VPEKVGCTGRGAPEKREEARGRMVYRGRSKIAGDK